MDKYDFTKKRVREYSESKGRYIPMTKFDIAYRLDRLTGMRHNYVILMDVLSYDELASRLKEIVINS